MLTATAQAVAHIQYRAPISAPQPADRYCIEIPQFPYVVWLSDHRPEAQIQSPTFISPRWIAAPTPVISQALLDWDAAPSVIPVRPSGEIVVELEYVGRGTPIHIQSPWV